MGENSYNSELHLWERRVISVAIRFSHAISDFARLLNFVRFVLTITILFCVPMRVGKRQRTS